MTKAASPRSILIALAVAAGLLWASFSGDVVRAIGLPSLFPYSRSVIATLTDVLVMLLLIGLAARMAPSALLRLSGIGASAARPLLWAAILFAPALLLCLLLAEWSRDFTLPDLLWKALAAPLFEELVYRGLAVGVLMRLAGWRLVPACLMPALFFGAIHAYQGATAADIAGAVAITGLGGLFFGWLFWRWHWNLWPAILLHAGLNMLWLVFALGETAVGGWLGNAMRAAVILGAILLTLRMVPKPAKTS